MRIHEPEGFAERMPTAKKVLRFPLTSLGPNDQWSADGHDKLSQIGFPIYGIRDKWSGKWLGLWVVPNNRLKEAVAYLFLSLVYEMGGKSFSILLIADLHPLIVLQACRCK
jgi:hypothetical protein